MEIITLNCNGIRAAARKGFFDWLKEQAPDVLCLQETKAQAWQLQDAIFAPAGYHRYFFDAEKKGYAGTAIYSRQPADNIIKGVGHELADSEGRFLRADFAELSVVSLYMPSGASGDQRQSVKMELLDHYLPLLREYQATGRSMVLCGDWNMCHQQIDLKNWRANQNKPGFLPEERAWLDTLYNDLGYADAFRLVNQEPDQYTWWSSRGQARANNVGWRLDYPVVTPDLIGRVLACEIYRDCEYSDHVPVKLTLV